MEKGEKKFFFGLSCFVLVALSALLAPLFGLYCVFPVAFFSFLGAVYVIKGYAHSRE